MCYIVSLHKGQSHGNGYAVISSQGSSIGPEIVSVLYELYAVLFKVVYRILILFTYHIQMSLYYNSWMVLISLCGTFSYDHIIIFILERLKSELLSHRKAVITYCLFIAAASGDFGNLLKIVKYPFRFKIFRNHKNISVSIFKAVDR